MVKRDGDSRKECQDDYHAQQPSIDSFSNYSELSEWRTVATGNKSIQALYKTFFLYQRYAIVTLLLLIASGCHYEEG